ncbi:MAG: glycerophosphodiester phosphodiesterase [Acidimicrobiales bacterium]
MTKVFAHRGLHSNARENTVDAFLAARALGADGVELDVRRTVDGALVAHHDSICQGVVIGESRRRDLPSYVPTLDEAMEACDGLLVNVEIKNSRGRNETTYDDTGDFARQVVRHLQKINWVNDVIVSCFDQATCVSARSFDAEIAVGWLLWRVNLRDAMTQAHVLGFTAVHPRYRLLTADAMAMARELELEVNTWTVNGRSALRAMVDLGVNAIITDEPAKAKDIVNGLQ